MKKPISLFLLGAVIFPLLMSLLGCVRDSEIRSRMDRADSLMWVRPDSSYAILKEIDTLRLNDREERARYALLMSMARDKNYIDTTGFDVLQPAVDYYLDKGDPDEKLRTYYYQGCIYKNRKDYDNAMISFLNAESQKGLTDSLVLANTFSAMGKIYHMQYKTKEMVKANLRAAKIYHSHMNYEHAFISYCRAFNGEIMSNNKSGADSLKQICQSIAPLAPEVNYWLDNILLMYAIRFGTQEGFNDVVNQLPAEILDDEINTWLTQGYTRYGDYSAALNCFNRVSPGYKEEYPLKYYGIETKIYDGIGDYEKAFEVYSDYVQALEKYYFDMLSRDLIFAEKRHSMEVESLQALQRREEVIWKVACLTLILLLAASLLYFRYVTIKNQKNRIEKEKLSLLEDKQSLNQANSQLKQEKEAKEKELNSKKTEISSLLSETVRLKDELKELQTILEENKNLSGAAQDAIKQRMMFLNAILASEITHEESYAKPFRKWIDSIHKDKKEFLDTTRLAFMVSHPAFIGLLQSHDLTEEEINYVCLYALKLRGKEIGEFIQLKSHYNISSEIRKKLGLDNHSTNLGNYIRKLLGES